MIDKRVSTEEAALQGLGDGARIMVSGFGGAGIPFALLRALETSGARDLTLIINGIRYVEGFCPKIFGERRVSKVICSAARSRGPDTSNYERQWLDGELDIEMVPQGTFAERIRAGGAGIAAFYTPTGVGTQLTEHKERREFDGEPYVMETAIKADFAFIRAVRADRWGNVRFRGTQGNFALAMAMAAETTVVETGSATDEPIDPGDAHIPGIFVHRVIELEDASPKDPGAL
ncbi:MAG: 3-oxoacid CoA-transferase subunit A [Pseudomonadota bacterium]